MLDGNAANDVPFPGIKVTGIGKSQLFTSNFHSFKVVFKNRILRIEGSPGIRNQIGLFTLKGHKVSLQRISEFMYLVPEPIDRGIYIVKTDKDAKPVYYIGRDM